MSHEIDLMADDRDAKGTLRALDRASHLGLLYRFSILDTKEP